MVKFKVTNDKKGENHMKKFIKVLLAVSAITIMLTGCETGKPTNPTQAPQNTIANKTNTQTPAPTPTPIPDVLDTWSGEKAEATKTELTKYATESFNIDEKEAERRLVDLDLDGMPELINITNEVGVNNIHLYEVSKDKVSEIDFKYGLLMGNDVVEIRERNGENHIFVVAKYEDGPCYESMYIVELMRNEGKMAYGNPFGYTCNQQKEEELRKELMSGDKEGKLTEEEIYAKAHTLKYYSKGEEVSKEQFDKDLKAFEEEYKLIRIMETKDQPKVTVESDEEE
jgi:hypothetical protein